MEHSPQAAGAPVGRGRRLLVGALGLAAVAAAAALLVDAFEQGPLEPRDPSAPGLGVLAGSVAEVPPGHGPQRPVRLRFSRDGEQHDVATRQGGAFALELPPGTYDVTAATGQGVCPSQVVVHAGGWQRNDLLWPCIGGGPGDLPGPSPGGPAPPGEPG